MVQRHDWVGSGVWLVYKRGWGGEDPAWYLLASVAANLVRIRLKCSAGQFDTYMKLTRNNSSENYMYAYGRFLEPCQWWVAKGG